MAARLAVVAIACIIQWIKDERGGAELRRVLRVDGVPRIDRSEQHPARDLLRLFFRHVGLDELLVVNVSTALLAGLMPIPGGIGVTEGALTIGLTAAGLPQETAFAVAILYRLASFYLPPVWGWLSFRWLQANDYL